VNESQGAIAGRSFKRQSSEHSRLLEAKEETLLYASNQALH